MFVPDVDVELRSDEPPKMPDVVPNGTDEPPVPNRFGPKALVFALGVSPKIDGLLYDFPKAAQ